MKDCELKPKVSLDSGDAAELQLLYGQLISPFFAKLSAEKQLLLSQRLILEPKLETHLAIQEVEEFGVGSGINNLELGLRLRYEINRGLHTQGLTGSENLAKRRMPKKKGRRWIILPWLGDWG